MDKQSKRKKRLRFGNLTSNFQNKEKIILRDFLAMERTTLANERTLFSYLRTSLYLALGGIAFLQLENFKNVRWIAYPLFGICLFLIIYGFVRYIILNRKMRRFYSDMKVEKFLNQQEQNTKEDKTQE